MDCRIDEKNLKTKHSFNESQKMQTSQIRPKLPRLAVMMLTFSVFVCISRLKVSTKTDRGFWELKSVVNRPGFCEMNTYKLQECIAGLWETRDPTVWEVRLDCTGRDTSRAFCLKYLLVEFPSFLHSWGEFWGRLCICCPVRPILMTKTSHATIGYFLSEQSNKSQQGL